ncbi:MAG: alpha-hydroxy acid oxidase [Actinomycetia bacterium]|nr:alpha-hydroxy acid oxidase [Actinomycetes bacterium]
MRPLLNVEEARSRARRRLPRVAFDFIDGGSDDEVTVRENRRAFERVQLRPRQLVNVQERSQSLTMFGEQIDSPVILAPTGLARIAGGGGDLAGAIGAGRRNTIFTLSTMSTHSIEDVARAATGPLWFQLYLVRERQVNDELVARAAAAGYAGLVVTVDVPVISVRERDVRNGLTVPPKLRPRTAFDMLRRPRWLCHQLPPMTFANFRDTRLQSPRRAVRHAKWVRETLAHAGATLADLEQLRASWSGPLIVKGTVTAEDALAAVDAGADGIVVSNHGGRQLDGCVTSLEALPEVADAVGDRAQLFLDGGVRRGTDVVKTLALGGKACLIGRPWLWGAACGGADGVERVLELLHDEIDRALALVGRPSIADLDRHAVQTKH